MKKEKQVKTYQRKTKSGKMTTVKAHTAKYDAADIARKALANKKGAGKELEKKSRLKGGLSLLSDKDSAFIKEQIEKYGKDKPEKKMERPIGGGTTGFDKKKPATKKKTDRAVGSGTTGFDKYPPRSPYNPKNKKPKETSPKKTDSISASEFKAWYHDPKSKEGRAAAKKLKEQVGAERYKEMNKKANDSYSSRGHLSMFKGIASKDTTSTASKVSAKRTPPTATKPKKLGKTPLVDTRKEAVASWVSDAENSYKKYQEAVKSKNKAKINKAKKAYINDMDYLFDHESKAYNKLHKKHGKIDSIKEDYGK